MNPFRQSLPPLPEQFLFGVATSDHQCEAYDPNREDIWDVWERRLGLQPRGKATDFWNRFGEDVDLARQPGCRLFRFSIAWSRVEPTPGTYDERAFEHYRKVVARIRAAQMEPLVTLLHFTWPVHLEQKGGMLADDFPEVFARYAGAVAERLGPDARYWVPLNEPSQLILGYLKFWWETDYRLPPGLPPGATSDEQMAAVGKLIRNLFLAHAAGRAAIKRANPAALVGSNPLLMGLPGWMRALVNRRVTGLRSPEEFEAQVRRLADRPIRERGAVDVVAAALTANRARSSRVAFSDPYARAARALLVREIDTAPPTDLAGWVVGVVRGSTAERDAPDLFPRATIRSFADYPAPIDALDRGEVGAVFADDAILEGWLKRRPGRYRLLPERYGAESYAVGVSSGSRDLLDAVDLAIQRIRGADRPESEASLAPPLAMDTWVPSRTLADLSGSPVADRVAARANTSGPLPLAPPGSALRRVQDRGYLVAAVRADAPGLGERDPATGDFSGREVELVREIARQIFGDPDRVRFQSVIPARRLAALRSPLSLLDGIVGPFLKLIAFFGTFFFSDWWHLGMAGRLPKFLCPPECVGQQDLVAFDYYWGIPALRLDRIPRLLDAAAGRYDGAPVDPAGLYEKLRFYASLFPGLPLLVAENGSVAGANDPDQPTYLRRHVREVQRAVRQGMPVLGYTCWSVTTNREWSLVFGPGNDFGLYHIDLDHDPNLRRQSTAAALAYRQIIAEGGVDQT